MTEAELAGPVLGVDFGLKRTGLAVCDPRRRVAVGAGGIEDLSGRSLARAVAAAARTRNAQLIVVGNPPAGARDAARVIDGVRQLARRLENSGFQIEWQDEDGSTARVLASRREIGGKARVGRLWVDEGAAVIILQNWLDRFRNDRRPDHPPGEEDPGISS